MKELFLIALILISIFGNAAAQPEAKRKQRIEGQGEVVPIIDAHTHTRFGGELQPDSRIPQTETQYFKEWREAGIVGAVAHTDPNGGEFYDLRNRNVIYCGGIEDSIDVKRIESGLKTGNYGCIKIYLGYAHRYAYDPEYEPIYKLAQQYKVPVVFSYRRHLFL